MHERISKFGTPDTRCPLLADVSSDLQRPT